MALEFFLLELADVKPSYEFVHQWYTVSSIMLFLFSVRKPKTKTCVSECKKDLTRDLVEDYGLRATPPLLALTLSGRHHVVDLLLQRPGRRGMTFYFMSRRVKTKEGWF